MPRRSLSALKAAIAFAALTLASPAFAEGRAFLAVHKAEASTASPRSRARPRGLTSSDHLPTSRRDPAEPTLRKVELSAILGLHAKLGSESPVKDATAKSLRAAFKPKLWGGIAPGDANVVAVRWGSGGSAFVTVERSPSGAFASTDVFTVAKPER